MPPLNPDHFDGRRFFNPISFRRSGEPLPHPHGFGTIWRWQRDRIGKWPDHLPTHTPAGDPKASPAPGTVAVTFLGHAAFLLRIGRIGRPPLTILTDPVFSERCSPFRNRGPRRVVPPGRPLSALPRIDVVLVSHCHYDHLDLQSLRSIAQRDDPVAITPLGNGTLLRKAGLAQVVERDWWENVRLPCGTRITVTPARHGSARTPFDRNRRLWGGFMIETENANEPSPTRVFFAGDSGHGTHWSAIRAKFGAPDIALLPIGAYEPRTIMRRVHMNPEEAVEACIELDAVHAIGMHFGTFRLTDEPIGEPPVRFAMAAESRGLPHGRCFTLGLGDVTVLPTSHTNPLQPPDAS